MSIDEPHTHHTGTKDTQRLITILMGRLTPSQLLDHPRAVLPALLHIVNVAPGVGVVAPSEPDGRASCGGVEGLEEDEDDDVVGVVLHGGDGVLVR